MKKVILISMLLLVSSCDKRPPYQITGVVEEVRFSPGGTSTAVGTMTRVSSNGSASTGPVAAISSTYPIYNTIIMDLNTRTRIVIDNKTLWSSVSNNDTIKIWFKFKNFWPSACVDSFMIVGSAR